MSIATQKGISLAVALAAVLFLKPEDVLTLFIVLGQAHFFGSYIYQIAGGKLRSPYALLYPIVLSALLGYVFFVKDFDLLVAVTAIQFLVHFLQDEVRILAHKHSLFTTLSGLPIVIIYSGFIVDAIYGFAVLPYTLLTAGVVISLYIALSYRHKHTPSSADLYFHIITGILFLIAFMHFSIRVEELIGFLIIFHYINWYLYLFEKFRHTKSSLRTYIRRMVLVNVLVIGAFSLYRSGFAEPILQFLFLPAYFYVGTLLHTLFTVRFSDYRNSIKRP